VGWDDLQWIPSSCITGKKRVFGDIVAWAYIDPDFQPVQLGYKWTDVAENYPAGHFSKAERRLWFEAEREITTG
jgi:hypothetical protein